MKAIIDADIIIFQLASTHQDSIQWDSETVSIVTDLEAAKQGFRDYMDFLFDNLRIDDMVLAISDKENWRKQVNPNYKSNRKDVVRPELIEPLREWIREEYKTITLPRLEADDVIGIECTKDPFNTIAVSDDKDMLTLPTFVYVPRKKEMVKVSYQDAIYNHLYQALKGDPVDGYSGCEGIGDKKARKILDNLEPNQWVDFVIQEFYNRYIKTYLKKRYEQLKESDPFFKKSFKKFQDEFEVPEDAQEFAYVLARDEMILNLRMSNILWEDQWNGEDGSIKLMDIKMIEERIERI